MRVCGCACARVRVPVEVRGQQWLSSPAVLYFDFHLSQKLNSLIRLTYLVSKLQGASCFCLPRTGIADVCFYIHLLARMLGIWQKHYEWAISSALPSPFKAYWTYFLHPWYTCLIQDGTFTASMHLGLGSQSYRAQFMTKISSLVVKEIPRMGAPNRTTVGTIFLSFPAANDSPRLQVKSVRNHGKYMLPCTNKEGKNRGLGSCRYSCSTSAVFHVFLYPMFHSWFYFYIWF